MQRHDNPKYYVNEVVPVFCLWFSHAQTIEPI